MNTLHYLIRIVLLLLLTIVFSCTDNNDNVNKSLIGTWSWTSSSGGIAGTTYTPATTGNNIDLEFTSKGNYSYYTNGIISSEGTYKFSTKKSIVDGLNKSSILFSADEEMVISGIDDKNLLLSDNNYDGYGNSYIKK